MAFEHFLPHELQHPRNVASSSQYNLLELSHWFVDVKAHTQPERFLKAARDTGPALLADHRMANRRDSNKN